MDTIHPILNPIILSVLGLFVFLELFLFAFCSYWRFNNSWRWYAIKTVTSLFVIVAIMLNMSDTPVVDAIAISIVSFAFGLDTAHAIYTNRK